MGTRRIDDGFEQLDQRRQRTRRSARTAPELLDVVDVSKPVDADGTHTEERNDHSLRGPGARPIAALAALAALVAGAFALTRHSGHRPAAQASSAARSSIAHIFDRGFEDSATNGFAPSPFTVPVTVPVPVRTYPKARAVGVKVGPLPAKYRHRNVTLIRSTAPKVLTAGHTYTFTIVYYARLDGPRTSIGRVSAPFSDSKVPADFRIHPGHTYTLRCRVTMSRGTDSLGFVVSAGLDHSSWESGATILLTAR